MITQESAHAFVREWLDAWNSHDLERVLAHFSEDCVFTSPLAQRLLGQGTVRGKDALRAYWARGLARQPELRFELGTIFVGQDSVVIGYRNHRGQDCAEWIRFGPDGLAAEGAAHYDPPVP